MKNFIAIIRWEVGGDHNSYQDFDTQDEADAHVVEFGGFVAPHTTVGPAYWLVDMGAETLTIDTSSMLAVAKIAYKAAIDTLRDQKKQLPILSEGYQIEPGTLSTGSMAVEIFAHSKSPKNIATLTSLGNVATAVFDKNHHLKNGVTITVSGVTSYAEYNVAGVVTVVDKKTITYPIVGAGNSPADGSPVITISTVRWITSNDQTVFINADDFEEVFQSCTEYLDNCQQCARNLKDAVIACDTVGEVEAINITTGWPSTGM